MIWLKYASMLALHILFFLTLVFFVYFIGIKYYYRKKNDIKKLLAISVTSFFINANYCGYLLIGHDNFQYLGITFGLISIFLVTKLKNYIL